MAETEEENLAKVFSILNKKRIPYIAIGGIPAILYGVERTTFDVDIAIPDREEIIQKVIETFADIGYSTVHNCEDREYIFEIEKLTPKFILKNKCVELRNDDKELFPIDIMPVDYGSLLSLKDREIKFKIGKTIILLPRIEDLIKLKEMAGRTKDLEDVKSLKQILKKGNKKYYE